MAPPKINDDLTLLEIAIIKTQNPDLSFAKACRRGFDLAPTQNHSWDSTRHRLQEKFKNNQEYWLDMASREIKARRDEQIRQLYENYQKTARHIAETVQPMGETLRRVAEQMRPVVESIQPALEKFRPMSLEIGRALERIDAINRATSPPAGMVKLGETMKALEKIDRITQINVR